MTEEQRVLHRARGCAEPTSVMAQDREVAEPVEKAEPASTWLRRHTPECEEQLPGADVQHAVSVRVDQREDGGCHGHAHAAQRRQELEPSALAAGGEDRP